MKRRKICIIYGEMKGDYNDDYIIGVEKYANELEYQVTTFSMLSEGTVDTNREECIYTYINFNEYDGVIFDEHSFSAHKHLARSVEMQIKKHCKVPIVTIGTSTVSEDCFMVDSMRDFEALTDHLIVVHGCRRIYFLGGNKADRGRRIQGFQNSIVKHGLHEEECISLYGGYWVDCAEKLARDIASGDIEIPEAVVCVTDIVAFALIKALFQQGIRVPEDVRVCGYNAHPCAFNSLISITTFPVNSRECGARAMSRLHELITGKSEVVKKRPPLSILTGKSCGCGTQSPANLKFRLAEAQMKETQEMYFRNGKLEEAIMEATSMEQMRDVVRDREYLIPNIRMLAINLLRSDGTVWCQYMSGSIVTGGAEPVMSGKLLPENIILPDNTNNYHVVPLVYNSVNYGYVIVGYREPIVYNKHLKQFCHCLALWCKVMGMNSENIVKEDNTEQVKTEDKEISVKKPVKSDKEAEAVFGKKNNLMHKIKVENIFYFEALDKKVYAITKNGEYEVSQRLFELEEMYVGRRFMRISKSIVINMDKIASVKMEEDRSCKVFFTSQTSVRVSRNYIKDFRLRIGM